MRIALGVEYQGGPFHGWQRQAHSTQTVQEYLENALSEIASHPIATFCAGRTDAGVSASGQVIHFECPVQRSELAWTMGVNQKLPPQIRIQWAKTVDETFHARFSAISRTYRYYIYNHFYCPALLYQRVTCHHLSLNTEAMTTAAKYLIGEHDFSSFRGRDCQSNSAYRRIERFILEQKDRLIIMEVTGNAFLHHMVRNIVGVLLLIGEEKMPPEWMQRVLAARDRREAAKTAAPEGLYLAHVEYPTEFAIPQQFQLDFLF